MITTIVTTVSRNSHSLICSDHNGKRSSDSSGTHCSSTEGASATAVATESATECFKRSEFALILAPRSADSVCAPPKCAQTRRERVAFAIPPGRARRTSRPRPRQRPSPAGIHGVGSRPRSRPRPSPVGYDPGRHRLGATATSSTAAATSSAAFDLDDPAASLLDEPELDETEPSVSWSSRPFTDKRLDGSGPETHCGNTEAASC